MSLKNAYREKMAAQLEEQRARLDLLKARTRRAVADGKIMAYEELADAESKFESAKARLKELGSASESAFEEMKSGVEKAWGELSASCAKAMEKIKGEP